MTTRERIAAYASVLRFDHWVKNLFLLPGFVFAAALLHTSFSSALIARAVFALVAFGFVASVNYTINEIVDAPFDRFHPTKQFRAVPSGKVSLSALWGICCILLLLAGVTSVLVASPRLALVLGIFFASGLLYNVRPFRFKDRPVLDVVTESINNPIRFWGGWAVVTTLVPPMLFLITFWALGAFWMTGKRYGEYMFFEKDREALQKYRASFRGYSEKKLLAQLVVSAFVFCVGYAVIAAVLLPQLVITIPFIGVYFAWYARMIIRRHPMIREPESLVKHPWFMLYNVALGGLFYYLFFVKR